MSVAVHIAWSSAQLIMALVGLLNLGIPPVAAHCADCNVDLLVWPCYNCGGQFCGLCIFGHADVPGTDVTEALAGRSTKPNEVSEGMHYHWWMVFQRLGSEAAVDPADAATEADEAPPICSAGRPTVIFGVMFRDR